MFQRRVKSVIKKKFTAGYFFRNDYFYVTQRRLRMAIFKCLDLSPTKDRVAILQAIRKVRVSLNNAGTLEESFMY